MNQSADLKQSDLELTWTPAGVPIAARFDDPYYSLGNGLEETRHVFLAGNDLPARFRVGFHVAELGFGTGLNLLATWKMWRESGLSGPLRFTSFEAYPMAPEDMAKALDVFPDVAALADRLVAGLSETPTSFSTHDLEFEMIAGDAREQVPDWTGTADAWFLDGFSPAKNPELWDANLLREVGAHTAANGTLATYTAAGHVRRNLSDAGFEITRVPGFGRKRHMTRGVLAQ